VPGPLTTFFLVTLPQILGGLVSGAILAAAITIVILDLTFGLDVLSERP